MKQTRLDKPGFEHIVVYEDGSVFDTVRNKYLGKPTSKDVVCRRADSNLGFCIKRSKLLGICFRAPWKNGIESKRLDCVGCSKYFATADGRIFGLRNMDYLKPSYTPDGYQTVSLYADNGDYLPWRMSRLIAHAFLPNPEGKDTVDHINNVRDDNRVENLRWCWMWENYDHRREVNVNGLTDDKVREICRLLESGNSQAQTARIAGVGRHIVKDIQYGSYYRITKDYNIPRYENQKRAPVFNNAHGQQTRKHSLDICSTTSP